jgi:protein-arginine kinase activator protein McsA
MHPEKLSEEDLINQIQAEEQKYQEVIKNDDLFKEAKKIRQRVKALKEKLIKLFPDQKDNQ